MKQEALLAAGGVALILGPPLGLLGWLIIRWLRGQKPAEGAMRALPRSELIASGGVVALTVAALSRGKLAPDSMLGQLAAKPFHFALFYYATMSPIYVIVHRLVTAFQARSTRRMGPH